MSGESDIEPHGVDIPVSELPISATARVRRTIDELPYVVHDGSAATELIIHLGTVQIVAVAYLRSDQLTIVNPSFW